MHRPADVPRTHEKTRAILQQNLTIAHDLAEQSQQDVTTHLAAVAARHTLLEARQDRPITETERKQSAKLADETRLLQKLSLQATKAFLTCERRLRDYEAVITPQHLPSVTPTKKVSRATAVSTKIRPFPKLALFRQDADGKPTTIKNPLFTPSHFLKHCIKALLENFFDPDEHLAHFITTLLSPGSHHDWAFNAFISPEKIHAKRRRRWFRQHPLATMKDFVCELFIQKFNVSNSALAHLQNVTEFQWSTSATVDSNFDTLETAASLADKNKNDDLVMSTLLRSIPHTYKIKLLEFTQSDGTPSFDTARKIALQRESVLAQLRQDPRIHQRQQQVPVDHEQRNNNKRQRGEKYDDKQDLKPPTAALLAIKPDFAKLVNPAQHPVGECYGCGRKEEHPGRECPQEAAVSARKENYFRLFQEWAAKVKAAGCFIPKAQQKSKRPPYRHQAEDNNHDAPRYATDSARPPRDRDERDRNRPRRDHDSDRPRDNRRTQSRRTEVVRPATAYDYEAAIDPSSSTDDESGRQPSYHTVSPTNGTGLYDIDPSCEGHHSDFDVDDITASQEFCQSTKTSRTQVAANIEDFNKALYSDDPTDHQYLVPVLIRDAHHHKTLIPKPPWQRCLAFADTGCKALQISYACATKHHLTLLPPLQPIEIRLAGGAPGQGQPVTVLVTDQVVLTLKANGKSITSRANVTHQTDDLLLGDRERAAFAITLANMPIAYDPDSTDDDSTLLSSKTDSIATHLDEADLGRERTTVGDLVSLEDAVTTEERARIMHAVTPALEPNAAIPVGNFTTHPDSTVHIETEGTDACYRRQYKLTDAAEEYIWLWLQDMLASGTVAPGDPMTRWMNPLLVSLDKKRLHVGKPQAAGPQPATSHDLQQLSSRSSSNHSLPFPSLD